MRYQGREGFVIYTTHYVRDASGNVMAVYEGHSDAGAGTPSTLLVREQHLYGSSRLGMLTSALDMQAAPPPTTPMGTLGEAQTISWQRGQKAYELSNHLGNVLVT